MFGYDEVIKLGSTDGKVLGTKIGNVYGITLELDIGTDLGSLDGYFDASNDGNIEGYSLETHWYLMTKKCLAAMKASN